MIGASIAAREVRNMRRNERARSSRIFASRGPGFRPLPESGRRNDCQRVPRRADGNLAARVLKFPAGNCDIVGSRSSAKILDVLFSLVSAKLLEDLSR